MNSCDVKRRLVLASAVLCERGVWTKGRVLRTYRAAGLDVPPPEAAEEDLEFTARDGLLDRHGKHKRRFYTRRRGQ